MELDTANLKVLVIDDHQLSRKLLGLQLNVFGIHNIDYSVNGEEGLSKLKAHPYDIVMLDWAMPVINGLEFLTIVKDSNEFPSAAFVMVSAEAQSDQVVKALEAGAIAYITKPINQAEINKKMSQVTQWLQSKLC